MDRVPADHGLLSFEEKEFFTMVIVMKHGVGPERIQALVSQLEREHGVAVGITNGVGCSILGLVGDTAHIDMDKLTMNDDVERVMRVQEPYKKANRKFHPEDTVADVSGVPIGGAGRFTVIAGPCSVESEGQIVEVARDVKQAGAALLRGARSSPAPPPTPSRAWAPTRWSCCWRPRPPPACPSCPRSWPPGTAGCLRKRWTWCRSAPGTCRTSTF